MRDSGRGITRREFLLAGTGFAAGALAGTSFAEKSGGMELPKSRVVLARDPGVLDGPDRVRPGPLGDLLDRAVAVLMETADPLRAWKRLLSEGDVVGIKTNVWPYLPTPEPMNAVLRDRVVGAGVRAEDVSADDRNVLGNPVFRRATALINVRPMRTHHWAGLGTLVKNYIMFVPDPSRYHDNACERLGSIWLLPHVKGKTRLNVLLMLTPLFHGSGPHHFSRAYTWPYGGLIVSRDPVAADSTGARILRAKRREHFGEERPILPRPLHVEAAATRYGLGRSDPERIELVRLGAEEGALL